ncbi:hypothetical protein CEXT_813871 [Caerostris extrusa]|uniref:Uncharacterized protein n=1 Tax=Caerostris extrusa TaxID=172846 RepID=A0AAV4S103_CAEEX|nr:hypothetical protein CEXT_813871 [Caerostris extrusa]
MSASIVNLSVYLPKSIRCVRVRRYRSYKENYFTQWQQSQLRSRRRQRWKSRFPLISLTLWLGRHAEIRGWRGEKKASICEYFFRNRLDQGKKVPFLQEGLLHRVATKPIAIPVGQKMGIPSPVDFITLWFGKHAKILGKRKRL